MCRTKLPSWADLALPGFVRENRDLAPRSHYANRATAERLLEEVPQALRQPLVIREPRDGSPHIRGHSDDDGFTPLASTGELAMITDTSGRSAPAALIEAARRYIEASGSPVPVLTRPRGFQR